MKRTPWRTEERYITAYKRQSQSLEKEENCSVPQLSSGEKKYFQSILNLTGTEYLCSPVSSQYKPENTADLVIQFNQGYESVTF